MKIEIRKSIARKINTAQYENIVVTCDIQISGDVKDNDDLVKFQTEVTNQLISDYKKTELAVLAELRLMEKPASVEQPNAKIKTYSKVALTEAEESEIFG